VAEAERLADTRLVHTVSESFEDYCFTPEELRDLLADLGCSMLEMTAAPSVAAYGYVGAPDEVMRRGLELERRFLGTPELVGAGEQVVGVFRKE